MLKKLFGKKDYNPQDSADLLEYLFFDKLGKPRTPAKIMLATCKIVARTQFAKTEDNRFTKAFRFYDPKKHKELKSMADYLKKGDTNNATKQCNKFIAKNKRFIPNDNKTIHPKAEKLNCVDENKFLIQLEAYRQRKAENNNKQYEEIQKMFLPNVISNKNIDNDKITKINEKRKAKKEILQLLNSFEDYKLTDKSFDDFNTIYKKFGNYKTNHKPKEKSQFVATVMKKTKDILSKLNEELTSFIEFDLERGKIKDLSTKINNFSMIITMSASILSSNSYSHTLKLAKKTLENAKNKLGGLRVFTKYKPNHERISNSDQKIKIGARNQKNNQPENKQNETQQNEPVEEAESVEKFKKRIELIDKKDDLINEINKLKDDDENKKGKMIAILKQMKEKKWKLYSFGIGTTVLNKLEISKFHDKKQKFKEKTNIEYDEIYDGTQPLNKKTTNSPKNSESDQTKKPENQQNEPVEEAESVEEFEKHIKSLGKKDDLINEINKLKDDDENKKEKMVIILKQMKEENIKLKAHSKEHSTILGKLDAGPNGGYSLPKDRFDKAIGGNAGFTYDDIFDSVSFSQVRRSNDETAKNSGKPKSGGYFKQRTGPQKIKNDENN